MENTLSLAWPRALWLGNPHPSYSKLMAKQCFRIKGLAPFFSTNSLGMLQRPHKSSLLYPVLCCLSSHSGVVTILSFPNKSFVWSSFHGVSLWYSLGLNCPAWTHHFGWLIVTCQGWVDTCLCPPRNSHTTYGNLTAWFQTAQLIPKQITTDPKISWEGTGEKTQLKDAC